MLSYWITLLSVSAYEVVNFIRSNSQSGILISVGSLFFVLGAMLRRHLSPADETALSQTPVQPESTTLPKPHREAAEAIAITYSVAERNEQLA